MNPGKHRGIRAAEGVGIQEQAEQHDIHGEKAADTKPDQQPGGFPLQQPPLAGDAIHDLHVDRRAGNRTQQPVMPR